MKQRCCLSSKIRKILKWWALLNVFWIRLRIVKCRFVKHRFVRYTLDMLDTDIPSKYFACLYNVFKTSSRHVFKTSSRHVFKTSSRYVFKTSSRHVFKTSSRHVLKKSWRRLHVLIFHLDVKLLRWRSVEDVFKTNKCLVGMNLILQNFLQLQD